MPIRKSKPTSPGRRFATYQLRDELTVEQPHKPLTEGKSKSGGRNSRGRPENGDAIGFREEEKTQARRQEIGDADRNGQTDRIDPALCRFGRNGIAHLSALRTWVTNA